MMVLSKLEKWTDDTRMHLSHMKQTKILRDRLSVKKVSIEYGKIGSLCCTNQG